jgi:molecular chaperone DnaK
MGKTVGIDLGTTNSCVVVLEGGEPTVIANAEGMRTTPSVVGFTKNGERIVGASAKRQAVVSPDRTIISIKRKMGTSEKVTIDGKSYTPEQISAMILQKLKADAEAYLGETVDAAVITVPAYFNDSQRTATKNAGQIAGLKVDRILNEPTAAALAYGLQKKNEETILVFDLGGGTFDVSILEVGGGVCEVKSTNGDTHLGGDDWDKRVMDWILEETKNEHGVDLSGDKQAMQRVREAAEKAKIDLSVVQQCNINLPFLHMTPDGPLNLDLNLTRARFEALTKDLVDRCVVPFEKAIKDAKITPQNINEIVLVGGSTRMPMIQELVRKLGGGKDPNKGVNPDEVVAVGAAYQSGIIGGEIEQVLVDVTPLSLGLETVGGVMTVLIPRNSPVPTRASETFTTAAEGQPSVEVKIFQGERQIAAANKPLGNFQLMGIPPAPKGVPQIEVTFDLDADGILSVHAKDKATGRVQSVRITNSSNLNQADIERMVREAQEHEEEDRRVRERAEAKNKAEALIIGVESGLKENGGVLPADARQEVERALASLQEVMKGSDLDEVIRRTETLQQAQYTMAEAMYQQSQASPAEGEAVSVDEDSSDEVISA